MSHGVDEAFRLVAEHGFCIPRGRLATHPDEAVAVADEIGYPVVLKIVSPDIPHKTDVGGVVLDCREEEDVRRSYAAIMSRVREHAPDASLEGISVQEMDLGGLEIIIGLNRDPQFGPCVMFGLGGIFTNVLGDVSWRVLPITTEDARLMIRETRAFAVLRGYRGSEPVSEEMLIDLLVKAGSLADELGERLGSVDLNPIAVRGDEHLVLDAKMSLANGKSDDSPREEAAADVSHLASFFNARSVAVVGASDAPGKIGNAVLRSLARHEYLGDVFPVNPNKAEVLGRPAFRSLSAVPGPVDLVVVTVALSLVPSIIEECAERGVHNMVIVSGGGKELGVDGGRLEAEIKLAAAEAGVRIVGCNCIGVFDGWSRLDTFFQTHERMVRPRRGPIAMITQSGTVGAAFLEELADVGISRFVSYGNRIDVDEADLLAWLAEDAQTRVIACYLEGLEDGRGFLRAAKAAASRKPIIVYKAGRSRRAAAAAASHTGFLGGSYRVALGAFTQAGLVTVDSYEELCAVTRALALQPRSRGPRVAMISNGAGTMVQGLDLFGQFGLELAALQQGTRERLAASYPVFYQVQNPVDVTGSATSADYAMGIEALLEDDHTDIVMPWFVFQDTPLDEEIVDVLASLGRHAHKPIVCGATGGPYSQRMAGAIAARGVPVFASVREWVAAARGLVVRGDDAAGVSAAAQSNTTSSTDGEIV